MLQLSLALIGLPGSGKTTVGRQLARRLKVPFVDVDHAIEVRLDCTIREFFDREGESRFRDVEAEVLAELVNQPPCVLSTGGGAVLRPENRQCLRDGTYVVYLKAHPEDLFRRLRHDTTRPLLQVADPMDRLRQLFAQRDPLYRETAHTTVETGRPSVATLVNQICTHLEQCGKL